MLRKQIESGSELSKNEVVFFELLKAGLWNQEPYLQEDSLQEEDWKEIMLFAKKQALLGVVFDGIAKLSPDMQPPKLLKLQWIAVLQKIEIQNQHLNQQCVSISTGFREKGFDCVILKGQGLATYYPNPLHRQSGDIDIYIKGSRKQILDYFLPFSKEFSVDFQHIHFLTPKADVECHTHCSLLFDPLRNFCLQRKLDKWTKESFNNLISLSDGEIPVPISEMNQVYILLHIFTHLFSEGVGLRQICDYALFMNANYDHINREIYEQDLKELGLYSFAKAVFYILVNYLGYPENKLPLDIDKNNFGQVLFNEVMLSGNFGKYDPRVNRKKNESYWSKFIRLSSRSFSFLSYFPRETISRPFLRFFIFSGERCMVIFELYNGDFFLAVEIVYICIVMNKILF